MKFAYADPPYLCGALLYKKHHPEWAEFASIEGHAGLINRLVDEYPDGWAMSMSSVDLPSLLPLMPSGIRVGAWVKPFASFKPGVNPGYCWEPVVFKGGRKQGKETDTVRDYVSCNITLKKGLAGAKPEAVCEWILDFLGFVACDTCDDLFPGTGVFSDVRDRRMGLHAWRVPKVEAEP